MHEYLTPLPDEKYFERRDPHELGVSSMRIHELALQRLLNRKFFIVSGIPIPVLFTKPMSAFSDFTQIWSSENNAFKYLLDAKDKQGTPLYQPLPATPKFPLITVDRKGWSYDSQRSFSLHRNRYVGWPTVSNSPDIKKSDLGYVFQAFMPSAWNYKVQVDHYATRPDSQAYFINQLQNCFFPSAATPQFWTEAVYPGVYGARKIRMILDGDISDSTEEEPVSGYRVYRTTLNLIIQGWVFPLDYLPIPALWTVVANVAAISPGDVDVLFQISKSEDLRQVEDNNIVDTTPNMPPS